MADKVLVMCIFNIFLYFVFGGKGDFLWKDKGHAGLQAALCGWV